MKRFTLATSLAWHRAAHRHWQTSLAGTLCAGLAVVIVLSALVPKEAAAVDDAPGNPPAGQLKLTWIDGLAAGLHAAQHDNRTLLVVAGSTDCVWCEKLAIELRKQAAVDNLKSRGLTLVHVDIEAEPTAVRTLEIGPIPALRILSSGGAIIASHDGFLSADELAHWLDENLPHAAAAPPALLTESEPPDAKQVAELIEQFKQSDPLLREAALRRLSPFPKIAVESVTTALEKGNLATRLMSLELLEQWHAPIEGIDPWRPETITTASCKQLDVWTARVLTAGKTAAGAPPTPQEIEAAATEIDRLADLPEADAEGLCERLARFHSALLPRVVSAWKAATNDRARQRLLMLRYRLVASDLLTLTWPGGLVRLASPDATIRHKAAEELIQRATADDQSLLLELFKDPDPLVREISLRGLQHVSPGQTGGALAALLDDPDPNVRAAVLKQLAENPAEDMAAKVAAYVSREKDPDLLVHALRFLKGMPRAASVKAAIGLLKHPNWQVRAEAVDALSGMLENDQLDATARADATAAMSDLMDDPEPFVISRVFHGLIDHRVDVAADRLVRAADKHHELTADVVSLLLARWHSTSPKDLDVLRMFFKQPDSSIRLSILSGLEGANAEAFSAEILSSLGDKSAAVREAAARLVFKAAESAMQTARANRSGQPFSDSSESTQAVEMQEQPSLLSTLLSALGSKKTEKEPEEKAAAQPGKNPVAGNAAEKVETAKPPERAVPDLAKPWLTRFRTTKGANAWMQEAAAPLTTMLDGTPGERIAAAMALVALGQHDERTLPILRQSVERDSESVETVAGILPWLEWERRQEWFDLLVSADRNREALRSIVEQMVIWPDPRAAALLWKQLSTPTLPKNPIAANSTTNPRPSSNAPKEAQSEPQDSALIGAVYPGLRSLYPNQSSNEGEIAATMDKGMRADLDRRAEHGASFAERVVALAILCDLGLPETAKIATAIEDDPKSSAALRQIALKSLLLAGPADVAGAAAIKGIGSNDAAVRRTCVVYLVEGVGALRDFGYDINIYKWDNSSIRSSDAAAVPPAPKGLTAAVVRPLLKDSDPDVAADAGYLLALSGESDGFDALVRRWRSADSDDSQWPLRVAVAISALDDATKAPLLEEIYKKLSAEPNGQGDIRQFYWTIRSMHGPEALKLRKKIRDDVGMDNLR